MNPLATSGLVTLGDRDLIVSKLSIEDEAALRTALDKGAFESLGPGGYFARIAPTLAWLRDNKLLPEWQLAVTETTRLQATGQPPSDDIVMQFRQSAKGVALELFFRTRKTHPEIRSVKELEAVITDANATVIHRQMIEAITGGSDDPKETPNT
jgi:hypothetical protein